MTRRKPPGWRKTPSERFWEKVEKTDTCWNWTGSHVRGYGQFWSGERLMRAHRWAYINAVGPIPDGHHLDHLCRNTMCVRPDHLEAVTPRVNAVRAMIHRPRRTHCPKGHPYSGDNVTYWGNTPYARCVTCERVRYYRTYPLPSGKRKPRKKAA